MTAGARTASFAVRASLAGALGLAGCGGDAPPPQGEVLVVVDTDLPVPRLGGRLRIDLYDAARTWLATRDVVRQAPRDWPTSFGVLAKSDSAAADVLVRLRAYPESKLRDYRGEARLLQDGVDKTPPFEPQPLLTVDRLIWVNVVPGVQATARVTLRGACLGAEAGLGDATSCTDTEGSRATLSPEPVESGFGVPGATLALAFPAARACTAPVRLAGQRADGTPIFDEEACVPGGMVLLGSEAVLGWGGGEAVPERVALIAPLRVDRFEVTVARWRQALDDGFVPPKAEDDDVVDRNEGPLLAQSYGEQSIPALCTFSKAPRGRETHALVCVDWAAARAFCQFYGADLPTEAQWEYLATGATAPFDRDFAWGAEDPTCERAVYGRWDVVGQGGTACHVPNDTSTFGPLPVDARAGDGLAGDVTPNGLYGLAGGASEWTLDAFESLGSGCWSGQGLDDPRCDYEDASRRARRGAAWSDDPYYLRAAYREGDVPVGYSNAIVGFRCVRSGTAEP